MYINHKWNKFMAVSCSHGNMLNDEVANVVLSFKERYKPKETLHLGDYLDATAMRSGAQGTPDANVNLDNDLIAGVQFLKKLRPTKLINGNHDIRAWELSHHPNAIISKCAQSIVDDVRKLVKQTKCDFIEEYDIEGRRFRLGDADFLHGYMYNENAIRDHAEHFGKCVFGHLHKAGMATGRRTDSPTAYCVGLLADIKKMKYANRRRATSQWNNAFTWGEYSDKFTVINISQANKDGSWRLPF